MSNNIVYSSNTLVITELEYDIIQTAYAFQNVSSNTPASNQISVIISADYIGSTPANAVVNTTSLAANLANYLTIAQFEHPTSPVVEDLDSGSF